MEDDLAIAKHLGQGRTGADVALDDAHAVNGLERPAASRAEVVDDDNAVAQLQQPRDKMAANKAGAAGY